MTPLVFPTIVLQYYFNLLSYATAEHPKIRLAFKIWSNSRQKVAILITCIKLEEYQWETENKKFSGLNT